MPPAASTAQVLEGSIKKARQFALSCDYKTALAFYGGLDGELERHCDELDACADPQAPKWRQLRQVLATERMHVQNIMHELEALANPAAAVRLDRQQSGGGDSNSHHHGGANPYAVPRPAGGGGARAAARPPYRTDDDDDGGSDFTPPDYASHPDANHRAPALRAARNARAAYDELGGGGGGGARRGVGPRPGDVNEHLYGDRDRFGPPLDDAAGPAVGFGVPPPLPARRNRSEPAGRGAPRSNVGPSAPSAGNGGAAREGRAGAAAAAGGGRKPAVPKFGKPKDDGAGGGKGGGSAKRERYQPRPGDEELAHAIASEMVEPGSINASFDDIAGQQEAKDALNEAVVYPALMPDYYTGILRPPKGVLLYGPPGTGKSMLAKAVAAVGRTTFFNVSPATLTSKMRGDSEKLIRVLFEMARHYSPSVIFIDEIDSLTGSRGSDQHEASRRTLSVLLAQMDGVGADEGKYVMLLGATNHPWDIDEAMRRRLERRIYIPLPQHVERVALFNILCEKQKDHLVLDEGVDFDKLSREVASKNYSGADLATVMREALKMPMRRFTAEHREEISKNPALLAEKVAEIKKLPVTMEDFRVAIRNTPSSVDVDLLARFDEWKRGFD